MPIPEPPSAPPRARELEPSDERMRRMIEAVAERVIDHVSSLAEQPAADVEGAVELAERLRAEIPREGSPLEELLDDLFTRVPKSFNAAGPGYLAYIPGGGLFSSALGSFLAHAVNRYTGVFAAAPALVQLELDVLRWLCDMVGLPATGSGGFLTSGGSLANLTALITARSEVLGEDVDLRRATVYCSDQVHHSVTRAARLAGVRTDRVRVLPTDDRFRLLPAPVEEAIAADRAADLLPFCVVASAGTTNTGAIDDLAGLHAVARRAGCWLHVDAAYGGPFMLTARGRERLAGLELADSITLDPHKGLFVPYGSGCLLVRDLDALRRTHASTADYMPPMQEGAERVDFCAVSPELSRPFRGLELWLPLRLHGVAAFEAALDEKLDLAEWTTEALRGIADVEIVAEPQLSLVAFRLAPPGVAGAELDALNRRLIERVNAGRRVQLTGTTLRGRFVLRICVLSFRTHRERMEMALEDVRAAVAEVTPAPPPR